MEPSSLYIPLGLATLLPLASFVIIFLAGPKLGKALGHGAYIATGAIVISCVLSFASFFIWIFDGDHRIPAVEHHGEHAQVAPETGERDIAEADRLPGNFVATLADDPHAEGDHGHADGDHGHADGGHGHDDGDHGHDDGDHGHGGHAQPIKPEYSGDYYKLGQFGGMELSIGYYIDTLTICMFCMVTLIASCIHFYAMGYMHDELHDIEDHEVTMGDGSHLKRPGRFHRFFQYLSLFCFSMLGIVLAGNIAMVFVFWELVGICSYFLIGFYVERESASTAANKAFIVNRVGDFGMIIGLMALWTCFGTFAFGDKYEVDDNGQVVVNDEGEKVVAEKGLFSLIERRDHKIAIPDGVVRFSARKEVGEVVVGLGPDATAEEIETAIAAKVPEWREAGYGYWLLIVAGVGIFCGCVGKSAQWPLHVWLPDAMEGPTPVSALVHSATMVAAGVYLVGRFFPVFVPEVLLVIATAGTITLFMAATIAITATDIKRVLAYSTVSQLGYMMLALGVGGWVAGLMHLITHAFFKSLLFMGSGSVIHAVHTNEMTEMGGLRKKMPVTAYTMLIGCLAIAGASIPFVVGFSGYYSKDSILEQAFSFKEVNTNSFLAQVFFWAAAGGAAITAFYMFRMWYMTFAGKPRDEHRYSHAHESPRTMTVPLMVTAFFATTVAWSMFQPPASWEWDKISDEQQSFPVWRLSLANLLEQARPNHTLAAVDAREVAMTWPDEHASHVPAIKVPVTWMAFFTAVGGIALATVMYCFGSVNPKEVKNQFQPIHTFLWNKWYFDELYDFIFCKPCHVVSSWISGVDRRLIDGIIDGLAVVTRWFSTAFEAVADRGIVDGSVNLVAGWIYQAGLGLRRLQTGKLRHYVMFIVLGSIALFVLVSYLRIVT